MGFAVVAGTGILMLAGVAAFGMIVVHQDAAQDAIDAAERDAERREAAQRTGAIDVVSNSYQPGPDILYLDVDNIGHTTFATADIEVLLDGALRTDDVTWLRVDGSDVAYWAPLEQLEIRLDGITASPSRAVVVTGEGIMAFEVV